METSTHNRTQLHNHLRELPLVPVAQPYSFKNGFINAIKAVGKKHELLWMLTKRELTAKYKDSSLGMLWALFRPLIQFFIYYLVIGEFLGAARSIDKFAIFIFCGLTAFALASELTTAITASITHNAGIIKKVNLPREIFPLAALGSTTLNFLLQFAVLLVATIIGNTLKFGPHLGYAVLSFAVIMVYALAFGLVLSALNVYLRDIQYFIEIAMMVVMWASPIVYSWTFVQNMLVERALPNWLMEIYLGNPLALSTLGFQHAFWAPDDPSVLWPTHLLLRLVITLIVGCVLLIVSHRIFAKLQGNFAQEI